jgi:hypothetical protein
MVGTNGRLDYQTVTVSAYSYLYRELNGKMHHYAFDGHNLYVDGVSSAVELPLTVTWTYTSGINGNLYLLKLYSVPKSAAWALEDCAKERRAL